MPETETTTQGGGTRSGNAINRLRTLPNRIARLTRAVAFWLAVVLPTVYLPLLFVETTRSVSLVSVLLIVHILTVFAGSDHEPRS